MSKRLWQCLLVNSFTSVAIMASLAEISAQTPTDSQLLHADVVKRTHPSIDSDRISQPASVCQLSEILTFFEQSQLSGETGFLPVDEIDLLSSNLNAASASVSTDDEATTSSFVSQDNTFADLINPVKNFAASPKLPAEVRTLLASDICINSARSDATISYSATDLGDTLVADAPPEMAQQPSGPTRELEQGPGGPTMEQQPASPPPPPPSRALNLPSLRSLRKPVGNKLLDTGVGIAGVRSRDTSENFWTRDFLTGNWGGVRDDLWDRGIDIYLASWFELFSNVGGGLHQETAFHNTGLFGFDFFTEKSQWWPKGQFHLTAAWIAGPSVARDYSGALNSTYFADPLKPDPRLFELWYGQKFDNDKGEFRFGKIFPFVRIASSQVSTIFSNTSFDYPNFIGTTPTAGLTLSYPLAPFGIQLSYDFTPQFYFIGQIEDGFDDPSGGLRNPARTGLSIGLSGKEGIEGMLELGYRLNQQKGNTGLPGTYKLGFQFHTGQFKNNNENEDGESLARNGGDPKDEWGNYAFYLMAEQMVYRESPDPTDRRQGLSTFFKTIFTPEEDINTISLNIAGGLAYEGLIPGRDRDVLGLAASYTKISGGLQDLDREIGREIRDGETVIELTYLAEIAPWWVVSASLQRIINPNGLDATPDATVVGLTSGFSF